MKQHIMISLGILLAIIFGFRLANEIFVSDFGGQIIYLLGGLVISGWLIKGGLSERQFTKSSRNRQQNG